MRELGKLGTYKKKNCNNPIAFLYTNKFNNVKGGLPCRVSKKKKKFNIHKNVQPLNEKNF